MHSLRDRPGASVTALSGAVAVTTALAALVALAVVAQPASAQEERSVTTHIVIGLEPDAPLAVSVEGEDLDESPFTTSDLGILSFAVDESGLPPGEISVHIGDPGELVISGLGVASVTDTSAVIEWTTNFPSNSTVRYGLTTSYGTEVSDGALVTSHSLELPGLEAGTQYHFVALSDDGAGHSDESDDQVFQTEHGPLVLSDVAVDSVGLSWAAVSWSTNRPATSQVEYGQTEAYGSFTPEDTTLVSEHSVVVSGLDPGTGYHLRALSDDGLSGLAASANVELVTDSLPPLTVSGVEVLSIGADEVTVGWTTNRPAVSLVEYGPSANYGDSTDVDPELVTAHEVTVTGLAPGTTYHYRVWSSEEEDVWVSSDDHEFVTGQPPLALWGVSVEQTGQTWAIVNWTTNRPAVGRVDYGPTDLYGETEFPGAGFVTDHSATLSGLAEGALYHFRVSAESGDGSQAASADSVFWTKEGDPTGPPQIDGVGYDVVSATSVLVSWTTDRPATSQVLYGTGDTLDYATAADTTAALDHSVLVWPVAPRVDYTFVVRSACGCDTTEHEPMVFRTIPPEGSASEVVPVDIIKVDIEADDTSAVVLWASDRPCSSWVEVGSQFDCEYSAPGLPLGEAVYTATVHGLTPGTTYSLRVGAWDAGCGETVSDDLSFQTSVPTDSDPPDAPTGLECRAAEGGVDLTWAASAEPDLLGYNVYRAFCREEGGEIDWARAEMLTPTPVPDSRFFDLSVESGASYEYAVTAVDESGNESDYSEGFAISVGDGGGSAVSFSACPNPMTENVRFVLSLPAPAEGARLRIVNVAGRVVFEERVGGPARSGRDYEVTWDGRDPTGWPVSDGVYMCELITGNGDSCSRGKLTVLR
ncbi:MAG: hypothetical protein GF400_08255 [Candidatus Eisenbacteria bacterium]|nr:hypothetical protein [Candidatus Eisenbacteria bacterium]